MRLLGLLLVLLLAAPAAGEPLAGADDPVCRRALDYSAARRGLAVLVLRDGKPVCEGYDNGGEPGRGYEIWSGTKSFTGLMAAAAVQDRLLGLDEPVADTLPEWRSDPGKARVTIRQLLSLTSGLAGQVGRPPNYADAVALPLTAGPGAQWQYGPAPFQVFGALLSRKLSAAGRDPDPYAYLKARLLDPIGLAPAYWRRTPSGDLMLPQGAAMSVREWVKLGELVRARGAVAGRPLVDPAALSELFKGTRANPGYGVSWWLAKPMPSARVTDSTDIGRRAGELPADLVVAAGAGDQRLYVIPSRRLVIARQARLLGARTGEPWSDTDFVRLFLP